MQIIVHAAGSLRSAMAEVAAAFGLAAPGAAVRMVFGASGLLKERIAGGERSDVFASANMAHPEQLATAGKAGIVHRFACNELCALVSPALDVSTATLVERMLDRAVRLGTSTPGADPSGDYAFMMFERIGRLGLAGAGEALRAKALQLTGGPDSPPTPPDRNVYGALVADGEADIFITYRTNATIALREQPTLRVVAVPASINVSAAYGVTQLAGSTLLAASFVDFLLGPTAQAILADHGFAPP